MTTPLHLALAVPLQPGEVLPHVEIKGIGRPDMPKTRRTGWEKRRAREKEKEATAEKVADTIGRAELVCHHGLPDSYGGTLNTETIVVPDSPEARQAEYWRAITPPRVSITVTLWPSGWGVAGETANVLRIYGAEVVASPVPASLPARLPVTLADGSKRRVELVRGEYHLRLGPGEEVVRREVAESVTPRTVGTGSLARARARQAARREVS